MRIGLVLEHLDPARGGLEQWTWQYAVSLLRRGHEVHVLARSFAPAAEGLPIVAHPLEPTASRVGFGILAQTKLRALSPDVVHDMGVGWHCDILHSHGGSWLAISQRKLELQPAWMRPWKRHIDLLLPRQREQLAVLARQLTEPGRLLVVPSQTVADDFIRLHGLSPEQIRVVYNGVDTRRFAPDASRRQRAEVRRQLGIGDRTMLALIVAHNFRLKGVPALLRAMGRLAEQQLPVHLAVVGGKYVRRWRRVAAGMGLADRVTFVGPVDQSTPYYAAADAYVHPTWYDPCSLVVLEGAASALPLVTTRPRNGAAELFRDGCDALLLDDPADDRRLAEHLASLLDVNVRQRLGQAARRVALRHTFEHNVEQILGLYDEVRRLQRRAA